MILHKLLSVTLIKSRWFIVIMKNLQWYWTH